MTTTAPNLSPQEETLCSILSESEQLWSLLARKFRTILLAPEGSAAETESSSFAQSLHLLDTASRVLKRIESARIANFKLLHPTKASTPKPVPSSLPIPAPFTLPAKLAPSISSPNPLSTIPSPSSISSILSTKSTLSPSLPSIPSLSSLPSFPSDPSNPSDPSDQSPFPSPRALKNKQKRERKQRRH